MVSSKYCQMRNFKLTSGSHVRDSVLKEFHPIYKLPLKMTPFIKEKTKIVIKDIQILGHLRYTGMYLFTKDEIIGLFL